MSDPPFRLEVLGAIAVRGPRGEIGLSSSRQAAILAFLAINAGGSVHPEQLVDEVWADAPPANGIGAVRYHISKLRDLLEPERRRGASGGPLATVASGYQMDPAFWSIDAVEFESLLARARSQVSEDPRTVQGAAERALALWREDEPYADLRHAQFAQAEIQRLTELRLQAHEVLYWARLAAGEAATVVPALEVFVRNHPYRERFVSLLMMALYNAGRQVEALRVMESARRRLVEELGIEPSRDLKNLEVKILNQDPALTASSAGSKGNVPSQVGSIVGREREVADLRNLAMERRLLTLTGTGGVGKTRLATELGLELRAAVESGCWFADLSGVRDDDGVVPAVEQALAMARDGPSSNGSSLEEIVSKRSLVLILDNCEHVLAGAASLARRLLAACPELRILATSRTPLGVQGEAVRSVEPLQPPPPHATADEIAQSPAVQLLRERLDDRGVEVVWDESTLEDAGSLCRTLDGLPLAIEIAARYLRVASISDLVNGIAGGLAVQAPAAGRPERHRSLELALDWSFDLLSEPQAHMFVALSVFRGSFGLEAVVAVCGCDDLGTTLEDVIALVDASLVHVTLDGSARWYRMLEPVRAYAKDKLGASDHVRLRQRHADYYAAMAMKAGGVWYTSEQESEIASIGHSSPNIQSAAEWLIRSGATDRAARLIEGVFQYWFYGGLHTAAMSLMGQVVDATGPEHAESARRVIERLANLLAWGGRLDEARTLADRHALLLDQAGAGVPGAPQRGLDAAIAWVSGDLAATHLALVDRARALTEADDPQAPIVAGSVAFALVWMGRVDEARAARAETAELIDAYGTREGAALLEDIDAWMAFQQGDATEADRLWGSALAKYRELSLALNMLDLMQARAWVRILDGSNEEAAVMLEDAQQQLGRLAMKPFELRGYALLSQAVAQSGDLARSSALAKAGMAHALRIGALIGQLQLASSAVSIAYLSGRWRSAARLYACVSTLEEVCSAPLPAGPRSQLDAIAEELVGKGIKRADIIGVELDEFKSHALSWIDG